MNIAGGACRHRQVGKYAETAGAEACLSCVAGLYKTFESSTSVSDCQLSEVGKSSQVTGKRNQARHEMSSGTSEARGELREARQTNLPPPYTQYSNTLRLSSAMPSSTRSRCSPFYAADDEYEDPEHICV